MEPEDLTISLETLCFIIARARQFDAKDVLTNENDASNATDDEALEILEDQAGDLTAQELTDAIRALNEDERLDLIALALLGAQEGEDWPDLRGEARQIDMEEGAIRYLLSLPVLADYLEEAIERFGLSCQDVQRPL